MKCLPRSYRPLARPDTTLLSSAAPALLAATLQRETWDRSSALEDCAHLRVILSEWGRLAWTRSFTSMGQQQQHMGAAGHTHLDHGDCFCSCMQCKAHMFSAILNRKHCFQLLQLNRDLAVIIAPPRVLLYAGALANKAHSNCILSLVSTCEAGRGEHCLLVSTPCAGVDSGGGLLRCLLCPKWIKSSFLTQRRVKPYPIAALTTPVPLPVTSAKPLDLQWGLH